MQLAPNSRVLITGASRGIGRALAVDLAKRGCTVGLVARGEQELEQVARQLSSGPGAAIPLVADVGDSDQISSAIERFVAAAGGIDLLVANAGIAWYGPLREMPNAEAERMTRINWLGTVYTVQAALPMMLDRAQGTIAIVSSAAGYRSFPWAAVYGATKHAQRAYLEALRHELSGSGVHVLGVFPGEVKTNLHDEDNANDRMPDWYRPHRAIPPEQVATKIVEAVERNRQSVFVPPLTRVLGIVHGVSPRAANAVLRRILGRTAAPWS